MDATRHHPDRHPGDTAGQPRADVVAYCLDALRRFAAMDKSALKSTVYEIALLGRAGLDTSDPRKKHRLQSLPGEFSGLHLVALLYTGLRQLHRKPSTESHRFSGARRSWWRQVRG